MIERESPQSDSRYIQYLLGSVPDSVNIQDGVAEIRYSDEKDIEYSGIEESDILGLDQLKELQQRGIDKFKVTYKISNEVVEEVNVKKLFEIKRTIKEDINRDLEVEEIEIEEENGQINIELEDPNLLSNEDINHLSHILNKRINGDEKKDYEFCITTKET
ncbi:MAG: hypothetical protein ABEJ02_02395 [Candidatus Paceibacteria bacterium]